MRPPVARPLIPAADRFYRSACERLAVQAERIGALGDWRPHRDPDGPDNPVADPGFYISEGAVLATGTVGGPPGS